MSLIVQPHDPREFEMHKKKKNLSRKSSEIDKLAPNIDPDEGAPRGNHRMRALIVDLRRPIFQICPSADCIAMFCPPEINVFEYMKEIGRLSGLSGAAAVSGVLPPGVRRGRNGEIILKWDKTELIMYPGSNPFDLLQEYSSLNQGQKDAVKKVLFAEDYALLLGLPGTGKTSTLSLIVRALIARGQKVLICSYTHSAVDNLLEKIAMAGAIPAFAVRIGYEASVSVASRG